MAANVENNTTILFSWWSQQRTRGPRIKPHGIPSKRSVPVATAERGSAHPCPLPSAPLLGALRALRVRHSPSPQVFNFCFPQLSPFPPVEIGFRRKKHNRLGPTARATTSEKHFHAWWRTKSMKTPVKPTLNPQFLGNQYDLYREKTRFR